MLVREGTRRGKGDSQFLYYFPDNETITLECTEQQELLMEGTTAYILFY